MPELTAATHYTFEVPELPAGLPEMPASHDTIDPFVLTASGVIEACDLLKRLAATNRELAQEVAETALVAKREEVTLRQQGMDGETIKAQKWALLRERQKEKLKPEVPAAEPAEAVEPTIKRASEPNLTEKLPMTVMVEEITRLQTPGLSSETQSSIEPVLFERAGNEQTYYIEEPPVRKPVTPLRTDQSQLAKGLRPVTELQVAVTEKLTRPESTLVNETVPNDAEALPPQVVEPITEWPVLIEVPAADIPVNSDAKGSDEVTVLPEPSAPEMVVDEALPLIHLKAPIPETAPPELTPSEVVDTFVEALRTVPLPAREQTPIAAAVIEKLEQQTLESQELVAPLLQSIMNTVEAIQALKAEPAVPAEMIKALNEQLETQVITLCRQLDIPYEPAHVAELVELLQQLEPAKPKPVDLEYDGTHEAKLHWPRSLVSLLNAVEHNAQQALGSLVLYKYAA